MKRNHKPGRLTAALLAAALGCGALAGCSSKKTDSSQPDQPVTSAASETALPETAAQTDGSETQPETEPVTEHISPTETVTSHLGTQIDVSEVLDRDNDNTYKAALSRFIRQGDVPESFTFVFYAGDGSSDIGSYQGGCGISVTADCAAATDDYWYQSGDFTVQATGSYVEVTWDVPAEIRNDVDANGDVLVGYWWGNTPTVRLANVICTYTRTVTLPVDSTETVSVGRTLSFADSSTNSVNLPLGDILSDGCVPQAITFDVHAGGSFGKFTGAFGITSGSDWYNSETIAIPTSSSSLSLTWILPDDVKETVPADAEVMFGYWWGEVNELVLQSMTIKYSYGSAGQSSPVVSQPVQTIGEDEQMSADAVGAAAIAADIRVGWDLGNTLDCYDITWDVDDYESGWGNPRTTQSMIDTVRAAGFNAVRIPVSWGNHMDDSGTVDAAWMDRVQEVVDYAVNDDLYVILNVHHDDYMWITPTYSKEDTVKARYIRLWEQIADRFKDYDTNLLFEGLNEPRVVGSAAEWTGGTPEEHDVINHLLAAFVDTVRASGGRNAERTLIVTTHAASITDPAISGLVVPDDDNLIVSVHNYAPWQFTAGDYPNVNTFDDAGKAELDREFDMLRDTFISKGIPVIIGEFGAENKDNTTSRAEYYAYYVSAAAQRGIPCFIWDNGVAEGEASYGLLNREEGTWYFAQIVNAIMDSLAE